MARGLKIILWTLGGIVGAAMLLVGAAALFFLYGPSDVLKSRLTAALEEATGARIEIEGALDRGLAPHLRVATGPVTVHDSAAPEDVPALATARSVEVEVALWPLVSGRVEIVSARIVDPVLALDGGAPTEAIATASLPAEDGGSENAAADAPNTGVDVLLRRAARDMADFVVNDSVHLAALEIVNGAARYRDPESGGLIELSDIDVAFLSAPDGGAASLRAEGRLSDAPATLAIEIEQPGALAEGGATALLFDFSGAGVIAYFEGDAAVGDGADRPLRAAGQTRFELSEDQAATAWARAALPEALRRLGRVSGEGRIDIAPERLDVALSGTATYNGRDTEASLRAVAGDGWREGAAAAEVTIEAKNDLAEAGYVGAFGLTPERALLLDGAYRLDAPDMRALNAWATGSAQTPLFPDAPLLESAQISGEAHLTAVLADATVTGAIGYNGQTITLDGDLAGGSDWRAGGESALTLTATAPGYLTASLSATIKLDESYAETQRPFVTADGRLRAQAPNVDRLRGWLEIEEAAGRVGDFAVDVDFALVLPQSPIRAAELQPDRVLLDRLESARAGAEEPDASPWIGATLTTSFAQMRVDGNSTNFEGEIRIDAADAAGVREILVVRGALSVGPLDLTPFVAAAPDTATIERAASDPFAIEAANVAPGGWSTEPIDFSFLDDVDAEIVIDLVGLRAGGLELGALQGVVAAGPGRLDLDLTRLEAFDGAGALAARLDASDSPPTLSLEGALIGLEARQIFEAANERTIAVGPVDFAMDLRSGGVTEAEIAAALQGTFSVRSTGGTLFLFDFEKIAGGSVIGLLGARQLAEGVTPYDTLEASFVFFEGLATNDDLEFAGPTISFLGSGFLDVGERSIEYRIRVTALGAGSVFDRVVAGLFPITARGSWDALKIGVVSSSASL